LGGGLTTLAALDIAVNTPFANPVVYSFASPRVGDPAFATRSNTVIQTHWRVLNTLDVIPLVPPEEIFDGTRELEFKHVDEWEPITFLKGLFAENHSLTNYIEALKNL
jgi:triacylglycerol lipase